MTKKVYVKDTGFDPIYKEMSKNFVIKSRVLPSILVFSGLFVMATQVILPLFVFKTQDENIQVIDNATILGRTAGFYNFQFNELEGSSRAKNDLSLETEYLPRDKSNVLGNKTANIPDYFRITIPKLGIKDALVETNAKSLNPDKALGHYPKTELPGEIGNSFIFGHSVLPWFFNSKNYKTIFSTLNNLKPGDEIIININNKDLKYVVESKHEVKPTEVDPLAEFKPKYLNESTITLMTCSPAGTKMKRLLVNAVIVSN